MRAVTVSEPGGPEVLGWGEVPDPVCGPGEVIVDVAATAVNRADIMQRQGFYPPPKGASDIIGLECSGVVSEVGEGVTGWSVGDEVCALLSGGGYAERVAVPAVVNTRAPARAASWMAMVPMPLDPPCTRKQSPRRSPACMNTFDQTVLVTSGSAAAVASSTPAGRGSSWPAGTATRSA